MKRTSNNRKLFSGHAKLTLRSEVLGLLASSQLINVKSGQSEWSEIIEICGKSETCEPG
jgi:hypothetical protein